MITIDGKLVSGQLKQKLKSEIKDFEQGVGRPPGLAVVLVGDDPASQVYVNGKIKACQDVGIQSRLERLPSTTTQDELHSVLNDLNDAANVDGILVQLPLPKHLNADSALEHIDRNKDVDALTVYGQGLVFAGKPQALPCTPAGIMQLFDHYQISVRGRHAVVIGRSHIVGKPMAQLLLQADATVTICHSRTPNVSQFTKQADIVVVAAGKPEFLGRDDFKQGSVVIDVGIHRVEKAGGGTRLVGDVRFDELAGWVSAATPVPGGVGPMTITTLLQNTLKLARARV